MNTFTRKNVYAILIMISLGLIAGRILSAENINFRELQNWRQKQISKTLEEKEKQFRAKPAPADAMEAREREVEFAAAQEKRKSALERDATLSFPFFSANDRSRWCTLRALVEPEMRVEGAPYAIDKSAWQKGYDTIDMVKHDGHYYSSKPPLFPTMVAGVYWGIHKLGFSMADHPFGVVRATLLLVNVPMMFVFLLSMAGLAERLGRGDWDRVFVVGAACFCTFLSTFCVTLNNHLPAVMSVSVALYFAVKMILDGRFRYTDALMIGLFGAFAAVNELPAASFMAAITLAVMIYFPWKENAGKSLGLTACLAAGALAVGAGFFGTNYIAHGTYQPPYAKRHKTDAENSWYFFEYEDMNGRVRQSYWQDPQGMDVGEPSVARYAKHCLVGHHGIFSLTPIWLLMIPGLVLWAFRGTTGEEDQDKKLRFQLLALMIAALTVLVCVFYITRPLHDRNYGGNTSGLRWCFWLAPLWLCAMLPALEKMEHYALLRWTALALLAFSALSVAYPTWNPWTQPWIYTVFGF